jgi:3-methyl-2-oxobutanoate hydroxymethyltransferase
MSVKVITSTVVRGRKLSGEKLVMVTAYDATFASLLDSAGVDMLLVGDSVGMVVQGHNSTLPVTLEHKWSATCRS